MVSDPINGTNMQAGSLTVHLVFGSRASIALINSPGDPGSFGKTYLASLL